MESSWKAMMDPVLYFETPFVLRASASTPIRLPGGCLLYHLPTRRKTSYAAATLGRERDPDTGSGTTGVDSIIVATISSHSHDRATRRTTRTSR
jgi:hypothetical protein